MRHLRARRLAGSLVAAATCALALGACGSTRKPSHATNGKIHSQAVAFSDCMRSHGVPNFPDPGDGGGGVNLDGTGISPKSPAFQAAGQACGKLSPRGARGGIQATESQFTAALRFAKCMRTQGFPSFPDPTRSDSPPGPIFIVGPGLFFRVSPSFDPNTPQAMRAQAACVKA